MRSCGWDGRPIPATARVDAVFCSKSCRQAAHRARVGRTVIQPARSPRRLAYADPPYPGLSRRYYADHPDYAGEVDHRALLSRLQGYDGWALSTSAAALPGVLGLAEGLGIRGVRVAVWLRGSRPNPRAGVLNAWEPLVYRPATRTSAGSARDGSPLEDVLVTPRPRQRPTLPGSVIGMKPPAYAAWAFELMGAAPGDELDDLFPGSGIVGRTWSWWQGADPSRLPGERVAHGHVDAGEGRRLEEEGSSSTAATRDGWVEAELNSPEHHGTRILVRAARP